MRPTRNPSVIASPPTGSDAERVEFLGRVSDHWGQSTPELSRSFYGFAPLRRYLYRCVTGAMPEAEPGEDWVERWTVENYLPNAPVENCLSLCCGFGENERMLARLGAFQRCTAVDVSPAAIDAARAEALREGLTNLDYLCADVENLELPPNEYDLVWANGALHHLVNVEHVVGQVKRALKPGGLFVANEYVGPPRQDLDVRRRELVNAVIHLIPAELRGASESTFVPVQLRRRRTLAHLYRLGTARIDPKRLTTADLPALVRACGVVYGWWWRATRLRRGFQFGKVWDVDTRYFEEVDPSEGVRSDAVIPAIKDAFDEVEIRPYNGSLLMYALDSVFYRRFNEENEHHRELLDLLTTVEETLVRIGAVPPDNVHILARNTG